MWSFPLFHVSYIRITWMHKSLYSSRSIMFISDMLTCGMKLKWKENETRIVTLERSAGKEHEAPRNQHPHRLQTQHHWTRITMLESPLSAHWIHEPEPCPWSLLAARLEKKKKCFCRHFVLLLGFVVFVFRKCIWLLFVRCGWDV